MKNALFLILFLSSNLLLAQLEFECDTLRFEERTGGSLDSIDISLSLPASTSDGNFFTLHPNNLSAARFARDVQGPQFFKHFANPTLRFSGLPRIGFHYSFGSKASQFFHSNYTQVLNKHLIFNIDYTRNAASAFLRNSTFEDHDLAYKFVGRWNKYDFELYGGYSLKKVNYSGGLVSDTLLDVFSLEFLPVNKSNANSRYSAGLLNLTQRLNFGDSLTRYGIRLKSALEVHNRKYRENDTLYGIYTNYVDSFETYDQFNLPELDLGAGIFFSRKNVYLEANYVLSYWEFQNSGLYTDTLEHDIESVLAWRLGKLTVRNSNRFNLAGNFGNLHNQLDLRYKFNKVGILNVKYDFANEVPEPFFRYYNSNNFTYQLAQLEHVLTNQLAVSVSNVAVLDSVLNVGLEGEYVALNNPYVWRDSIWRNDIYTNLNALTIRLKTNLNWKALRWNNQISYTTIQDKLLPDFALASRLYLQHPVFSSKKMILQYGAEFQYFSGFQQRSFLAPMDVFQWDNTIINPSVTNLHAFAAFQIDEFRFYLRFENLGSLWNELYREDVISYPLVRTRFRIGVSWDFFN